MTVHVYGEEVEINRWDIHTITPIKRRWDGGMVIQVNPIFGEPIIPDESMEEFFAKLERGRE